MLLLALLVASQMRAERALKRSVGMSTARLDELGYRLQRAEAARAGLEQQLVALRAGVVELERGAAQGREEEQTLMTERNRLKAVAGFTPVSGPGALVVLDDSPRRPGPSQNPNDLLVHYTDLQAVVNDLRALGFPVRVVRRDTLILPAYLGALRAPPGRH